MEQAARGDAAAAAIVREMFAAGRAIAAGTTGRVAVCICTAQRPKMLAHCLGSLAAQIVPDGVELHIVVVDNEAQPNNSAPVQEFAARCPFPVHYVHEPRRGIPQARNAALERCAALDVDWIAFTDDDCWASPSWLASHLEAADRHGADVVQGRHEWLYPLPLPFWARPRRGRDYTEGQILPFAATNNVFFTSRLIRHADRRGMRFDERLAFGEDVDLFLRAARRGARIVHSGEPLILEIVPAERTTFFWQVRRTYHFSAGRSYFDRRHHGPGLALAKLARRWLLKAPMGAARILSAPLVLPVSKSRFKKLVLTGALQIGRTVGATAGFLGVVGDAYKEIDGH